MNLGELNTDQFELRKVDGHPVPKEGDRVRFKTSTRGHRKVIEGVGYVDLLWYYDGPIVKVWIPETNVTISLHLGLGDSWEPA